MTADRIAVACGAVSLTEVEFRESMLHAGHGILPEQIVPIVDADRLRSLARALAVRARGGIPLLGDDRWQAEYWSGLLGLVADAGPLPGMAWAAFSSGSTGMPRVILRSEDSWSSSFSAVTKLMELESHDLLYLPAPLASSLSLFSVAHARWRGAGILLPRTHGVTAADLEVATAMHGTPQALKAVVEALEGGARHQLRTAMIGGAQLDSDLRERAERAGIRVISYYGAAELSFVAVDVDGDGFRAFPGAELRVDEGELWVRSPYQASGYLGGATGSLRRDDDGWATVGDLVDGELGGPLRFLGRRDGAILTAAATVIPEDVEAALRTIAGIEDAVVFGLPNPGAGSLVGVLIEISRDGSPPSLRELREQAATRLALSHLPRRWFWTERLPRAASGKPARALIRQQAIDGEATKLE